MPQQQSATRVEESSADAKWQGRFDRLARTFGILIWSARSSVLGHEIIRRLGRVPGGLAAEPTGDDWLSLVHPEDREDVAEAWRRAQAGPQEFDAVFRLLGAAGAERWLHVRMTRSVGAEDEGEFEWTGVATDETDLRETQELLLQREARLDRTLEGIVTALGGVVELRDPYTAGHQRRVTRLAVAIGRQLGWEAERLHALQVAALLHDVGKISCPSELLTKPTRLSETEMNIIRTHPAAGGAILSSIHFEGPVLPAVLQHHERLDGSGYPAGLAGERIVPCARVIAVADVVEAMASHRPYRPALGVEAALAEVQSGRGRLYDDAAVDACLAVFAGGFDLDGEE